MKLYSNISYLFIIWFVSVLLIANIGFFTLPHSGNFSNNFWESFGNWDGGHFLGIAKDGYSEKYQYAFFPLYPLTVKLFSQVIPNFLTAGVLINFISVFIGASLLYRLVSIDFDKKIAEKSVFFLLLFPTSFYFLTAYSEGLFFLFAVATFYFLRQNKLLWATIFASLASATRLIGLAVVAGLLIEVITQQGINRKNWFVLLAPLGLLIYCIFLYRQTGDPLYFITAENHWQRTLTVPGVGFWETIKNLSVVGINLKFNVFLDLMFAIFGVGLAIRGFRFLPTSLTIYTFFSVLIPLFTPTLSSIPRFLLVIFPIFILIALIKNDYIKLGFQVISIALFAIFTALFFRGYWVS